MNERIELYVMREDNIHIRLHYHCYTHHMSLDPGIDKSNPGLNWSGIGTPIRVHRGDSRELTIEEPNHNDGNFDYVLKRAIPF